MSRSTSELPSLDDSADNNDAPLITMEIIPPDLTLAVDSKQSIESAFMPFFVDATRMQNELAAITSPKIAKVARLEVKKLRNTAEKKRVEMKAEYLIMSKAIDGANRLLLSIVEPLEKSLEDIELAEARKIVAEREEWTRVRLELIKPFLVEGMPLPNVTDVTDVQFEQMLEEAKVLHQRRVAAAHEAELERLKKAQAEAEEQERIRLENEKLKREAAAAAQKLAAERAETARVLAAQQAKAAQEATDAKAAADRLAAANAELLRQERVARVAAEEKAKAAAPAPVLTPLAPGTFTATGRLPSGDDKSKLLALASQFRAIQMPVMSSLPAGAILKQIVESRDKFAKWIEEKSISVGMTESLTVKKQEVDL